MNPAFLDQIEAALAETRGMVSKALGVKDDGRKQGISRTFEEIWATASEARRCKHLEAAPVQPWIMGLPDRTWRCRSCSVEESIRRLRLGLSYGPIEEHTCDRCRRYVPPVNGECALTPVVIRQDIWLILASACGPCGEALAREGATFVAPPEEES